MEWLELYLVGCLLGQATRQEILSFHDFREPLLRLLGTISSPTTSYQIGVLAIGLARLFADGQCPISIKCARTSLEELARSRPEVARLARGTSGQRAEYISLDPRKI